MKKSVYSIIVFITSTMICLGQGDDTDYIINLHNDTIRGKIREQKYNQILFKTNTSGSFKLISIEDINSYVIDNVPRIKAAIALQSDTINMFIKRRIKGYVSLYEVNRPDIPMEFAIELPNHKFIGLPKSNLSWTLLKNNLWDCHDVKFERVISPSNYVYSLPYFIEIINTYNNCILPNQKKIEYKSKFSYSLGATAGLSHNNWNYSFSPLNNPYFNLNGSLSSYNTYTYSMFFCVKPEKPLSYMVELIYNQYEGNLSVPITNSSGQVGFYKLSVTEKYISIPLEIKYSFKLKQNWKTYLKAGLLVSSDLKFQLFKERTGAGVEDFILRKSVGFGYIGGWGITKKLNNYLDIFSELRFTNRNVQDGVTNLGSTSTFQVAMGLSFSPKAINKQNRLLSN